MIKADIYKVENHNLVLDHEYIRGIPEFKCILERRISSKGDADGRKKLEHWRIFMYIKIVADMFSYPNQEGRNAKDVHIAAIREAGLSADYKPDDEVLAAIEKFKEIQFASLPVLKTIGTILKALKLSDVICKTITDNMEKQIDMYKAKIENSKELGEANIADSVILVNGLIEQLGQVNKIAITIPKTQDVLENLEERLKKESAGIGMARGDKKIGNRAEPKQ